MFKKNDKTTAKTDPPPPPDETDRASPIEPPDPGRRPSPIESPDPGVIGHKLEELLTAVGGVPSRRHPEFEGLTREEKIRHAVHLIADARDILLGL
jgi:hypothetical protein